MFCKTCGKRLEKDISGFCPECNQKKKKYKIFSQNNTDLCSMKATHRFVALIIDAVLILIFVHFVSEVFSYVYFSFEKLFFGTGLYFFFFSLSWFCYSLITESLFNTTVGKFCLGGRVVGDRNSSLTFGMVLQRNIQKFWLLLVLSLVNLISTYLQGFPALVRGLGVLSSIYTSTSIIAQLLITFLLIMQWVVICFDASEITLHDKVSKTSVVRYSFVFSRDWLRVVLPLIVLFFLVAFNILFIILNEREVFKIASMLQYTIDRIPEESDKQVGGQETDASDLSSESYSYTFQQPQESSEIQESSQPVEELTQKEDSQEIEVRKLLAELKNNVFYSEQLTIIVKLKKIAFCNPEVIDGIAPYLSYSKEDIVSLALDVLKSCNDLPMQLTEKLQTLSKSSNMAIQNKAKELLTSKKR